MKNYDNKTRHIGIELEFAGLTTKQAAKLVADVYGGTLVADSAHQYTVKDTDFGKFTVELDTQYAHPKSSLQDKADSGDKLGDAIARFDSFMAEVIGDVAQGFVPCEIVTPPIPINRLDDITPLMDALKAHNAEDTRKNPFYAFGMHLNPEVTSTSAASLCNHLKAFILLEGTLRKQARMDTTRKLLPHTAPFPKAYALLVTQTTYTPNLSTLIDDYIKHNPTRNRDLDMLCVFKWLDKDRVENAIPDMLVKARPTFHYRLPDFRISDPDWSVQSEWAHWQQVEALAHNAERLERLCKDFTDYLTNSKSPIKDWDTHIREAISP